MVCGGTSMGLAVQAAVTAAQAKDGGGGEEAAERWMEEMVESSRYVQELWS